MKEITNYEPDQQDIIKTLEQLKRTENEFREVLEHCRGDLGQIIRMIRPIVLILKPGTDIGKLVESETEDAVITFLNQQDFKDFDGKRLIAIARNAHDRYEIGAKFHKDFGEGAQLAVWNKVLSRLGETFLINEDAESEFRDNLASVHSVLKQEWRFASDWHAQNGLGSGW